jgi:hypothetical protein
MTETVTFRVPVVVNPPRGSVDDNNGYILNNYGGQLGVRAFSSHLKENDQRPNREKSFVLYCIGRLRDFHWDSIVFFF